MKKAKLFWRGALDAVGVLAYISLVALFMSNGSKLFGEEDKPFWSPILFLLLFVFSALVTSFLVLGKPVMLYFDGHKKEAVKLLFYTGVSLFVLLLIFFGILILMR